MFGLLSNLFSPKIKGELGCFGLGDWWLTTFSANERNYIEQKFKPLGGNSRPLTHGKILETTQTASNLLMALAGWFEKAEDFSIGKRIVEKAIQTAGNNTLDAHFAYGQMIKNSYRVREVDSSALELAIFACKNQIVLAPQAAKAFRRESRSNELPCHAGYEQLAIILEKQKDYSGAIQLCNQAKEQGWNGDWDKRIARYKQKREKIR
jgi:hypothetical protein